MLIEVSVWEHTAPHRYYFYKKLVMRKLFPIALCALLFAACTPKNTPDTPGGKDTIPDTIPDPIGTIRFTESDSIIPNPERGLFSQTYFTSADLETHANATVINNMRHSKYKMTLYLHSYYLTDYMESDIPQEFLDRLETNMNALREGGGKVVLRFSYKYSMDVKDQPWNASEEWIHKHIDQIAPYLQKHADVILYVQCGLIGSWGEWYYTSHEFKMNPVTDADYEPRWRVLEHMLQAVPETRQVALRTPEFKMRYLKMRGDTAMSPLTAAEAHKTTNKARIGAHNDCFVSSATDVGTYRGAADREFWAEDTKYTIMGGETCEKRATSEGSHAISEMEKYHWTYLNRDYREEVTRMWRNDGTMDIMMKRLGYRLVLDKAVITPEPEAGKKFEIYCELRNVGFASPMNKRALELILVSKSNPNNKYVYPQTEDPRFWLPGEHTFTLACTLDGEMKGEYDVCINLPDPCESLHNDPRYSIRLANENVWDEATGYNRLTTITVQ